MPVPDEDYRLESIRQWHEGKTWHHAQYKQPSPTWDHDHCILCWRRLAEPTAGFSDAQYDGYTDEEDYHWMCNQCFSDLFEQLKDRLQWTLREQHRPEENNFP